jgi:hypothetical protein
MKTINLKKIVLPIASLALLFSSACNMLDRPPLTTEDDDTYWTSEDKVKAYAYGFYPRFFVGYNSGWGTSPAPNYYNLTDNTITHGAQAAFELIVPTSRGSSDTSVGANPWMSAYDGPNWHFGHIRRANIMNDRVTVRMADILTTEQAEHWSGIARFFRAMNYAQLVQTFGDVPYFDTEVASDNLAEMYKPRTPRDEVMDHVYDDFKFAMEKVRTNDGSLTVNKYVVAAFVSRFALFEGTWQKYHLNNSERAQKFLQLAVDAADVVMSSTKFDITMEFRDQFTQTSLEGKPDVIFWRNYGTDSKHRITTDCNFQDGRYDGPNLALIKSFILSDGQDWQQAGDKDFTIEHLVASRDPRFEGSFYYKVSQKSFPSFLYVTKFIPRAIAELQGQNLPAEYQSNQNLTAYPVMRYAEVLLNWIEAKAELGNVSQPDIDASINKIRNRPVAAEAAAMGVVKTAPMNIDALPNDPARDADVPALLWEIRRERRMEFAMESSRLLDLKRWKKLEYMNYEVNPDILLGTWVDGSNLPAGNQFTSGSSTVTDWNGTSTVFDGSNAAKMKGFYSTSVVRAREPFLDVPGVNPYLAPLGIDQQRDYENKGYHLEQTEGWPTGL